MSEPAPDVDPDRDFRTVPDGHQPGTPTKDSLAGETIDDSPDPDHPGLGGVGDDPGHDPGDEGGSTGSDEDLVRRAAGMKPSKETGHAGSSSDRPPALDPD